MTILSERLPRSSAEPAQTFDPPAGDVWDRVPDRPARDDRLDFFRGILQAEIFLAHLPDNPVMHLLHRSLGFSDSSELFVFFSGYVLASVFALKQARQGFPTAARDIVRRAWRLYTRHLLMLVGFVALTFWAAVHFGRPDYVEGTRVGLFLADPGTATLQAILLGYQPVFLDVLPVFVLMMAALPLFMALPARLGWLTLVPSVLLWAGVQVFGWQPPGWPQGWSWTFNPLAWFLLFSIGAFLGRAALFRVRVLPGWLVWPAAAYLVGAALASRLDFGPWPIDKTDLSPWAISHALALALVVARLTRARGPAWEHRLARPFVAMGRNSLDIFCWGTFASMVGYILTEAIGPSLAVHAAVAVLGVGFLLVVGMALERLRAG